MTVAYIGMPYGMYYYDATYMLVVLAAVISLAASAYCKHVLNRYSQVRVYSGMTGRQTAERVLYAAGIHDVRIEQMNGVGISFYRYDKSVHLSNELYGQPSITAVATAAYECGHAMQHNTGYIFNRMISALHPAMQLCSNAAIPLFMMGLIFSLEALQTLGIILFSVVVVFQLVTLPSEFNASRRAIAMLKSTGILQSQEEVQAAQKVLFAAALTYVAALANALLQLLRLILLSGRRNNRD